MKKKDPAIVKLKANKKINYKKIEKFTEEKSPLKKKSSGTIAIQKMKPATLK